MRRNLTLNKKGEVVESRLKYGNEITVRDGIKFRSKGEADRYSELKLLQSAGEISNLKWQQPIPLWVEKVKVGLYIADFTYNEGGNFVIEDFKGKRTALFILKWNILHALHDKCPGIILRVSKKGRK